MFEDAINEDALDSLDETTLDQLIAILTKAGY